MKSFISIIFAAGIGFLGAKELPPVPELKLPTCRVAPVIDGRLDDPAWKTAAVIPELVQNNTKFPNMHPTRILAACDAENLYVAFICNEPDLENLARKKAAAEYDGPVWMDDCVEVYLGNAENPEVFSQYVVNWAGGRYDGIVFPGRVGKPMQFHNLQWKSAVSRNKNEWIVEFAIPFYNADIKPSAKSFRINFFREKYHSPGEMLAWSRTYERIFAIPSRFGIMHKTAEADDLPGITSVKWPDSILGPSAEAVVSLHSPEAWAGELIAAYAVGDTPPIEFFNRKISLGKNENVTAKCPLARNPEVDKAAFLIGFRKDEKTFWRKHRTLELLDNFKMEKSPSIVAAGEKSVAAAVFRDASTGGCLDWKILDAAGKVLRKQRLAPRARLFFTLPTDELSPGNYRLIVETPSGRAERPFTVISGW